MKIFKKIFFQLVILILKKYKLIRKKKYIRLKKVIAIKTNENFLLQKKYLELKEFFKKDILKDITISHFINQVSVLSSQKMIPTYREKQNKINQFEKIIYFSKDILNEENKFIKKDRSFALNNIDLNLQKYLNYKNGYFIEMGANDGVTQSNTLFYELNYNWNGILIEPNFNNFLYLKFLRSNKNKFYNFACVSNDYKENFIDLEYDDLKTSVKNKEINKNQGISYICKTRTLNDILIDASAPALIDFFSLDVEGYEYEVLNGINFDSFNFKYLLIETNKFELINNYLKKKKYKYIEKLSYHDYLFRFDN